MSGGAGLWRRSRAGRVYVCIVVVVRGSEKEKGKRLTIDFGEVCFVIGAGGE